MKPRHHRSDRDVEDLGDLLVGEPLDVGEEHRHPEVLGERLERSLYVTVDELIQRRFLG